MVLAMCQLRSGRHSLGRAIATLREGGGLGSADIGTAAFLAWRDTGSNMLRARLALYLRARLRADAGDFGQVSDCVLCFGSTCAVGDANCVSDGGCCPCHGRLVNRRITPLWEQAR